MKVRKLLAMLLVLSMVLSITLPTAVLAAEGDGAENIPGAVGEERELGEVPIALRMDEGDCGECACVYEDHVREEAALVHLRYDRVAHYVYDHIACKPAAFGECAAEYGYEDLAPPPSILWSSIEITLARSLPLRRLAIVIILELSHSLLCILRS